VKSRGVLVDKPIGQNHQSGKDSTRHHKPLATAGFDWLYPANVQSYSLRDKWVWRKIGKIAPLIADLPSGKVNHLHPALAHSHPLTADGQPAVESD